MEKNNKVTSSIKKLIHPTTQTHFLFVNKSQFAIQHTSVMANRIFHTLHVFGTPLNSIQFDPNKAPFVIIRNPQEFLKTLPQEFIEQHQLHI